jgi:phage tail-like protein
METSSRLRRVGLLAVIVAAGLLLTVQAQAPKQTAGQSATRASTPSTGTAGVTVRLEIQGLTPIPGVDVEQLKEEVEVIEYQDGNELVVRKRPGRRKSHNLVVKLQPAVAKPVRDWFQQLCSGRVDRKTISVVYLDNRGTEIVRYNLSGCFVAQWRALALDEASGAWLETVEFATEGVERVAPAR